MRKQVLNHDLFEDIRTDDISIDDNFIFFSLDKPNKRVTGDPDSTLFVGKLSKDTSQG